jgi:hypothetical protein
MSRKGFTTEEDLARVLALPVLAAVPRVTSRVERAARRRRVAFTVVLLLVIALGAGFGWWKLQL